MNIRVTDEDVKATILAYPGFQRNGVFDQRIYEQTLRANKMTPEEFEEIQRKMLITIRVEDLIQDGVKVSDQEIHDLYLMQNEKINIDFIQISPQAFCRGSQTDAGRSGGVSEGPRGAVPRPRAGADQVPGVHGPGLCRDRQDLRRRDRRLL